MKIVPFSRYRNYSLWKDLFLYLIKWLKLLISESSSLAWFLQSLSTFPLKKTAEQENIMGALVKPLGSIYGHLGTSREQSH